MAALPTLFTVSTIDAGGWTDEAGGNTDLHSPIGESGAADGAHIRGVLNGATTQFRLGLTDMPADFVSMTSLDIEIRHSRGATEAGENGTGDDTIQFRGAIRKTGPGTILAGRLGPNDILFHPTATAAWLSRTDTFTCTFIDTAATKTDWDAAELVIEATFAQSMGADGDRIWIDFVRGINGVYVASGGGGATWPGFVSPFGWQ